MNQFFRRRETCPVCTGEDSITIVERPLADELLWNFLDEYYKGRIPKEVVEGSDYRLVKCNSCKHLYQQDILVDDKLQELYEVWISPDESLQKIKNANLARFDLHASQVSNISRIIGKKPGEVRVLEFGMGWGFWLQMAKAYGYQAFGAELSKPRIEFAEGNGLEVIQDLESDRHEPFDYIFSNQVFEHVAEPFECLELLAGKLKPNGYIHIAVPQGTKVRSDLNQDNWKPAKDAIHPLEHINCFTRKNLETLADRAGFRAQPMPRYSMAHGLKDLARSFALFAYNRMSNTDVLLQRE